MKKLFGIVTLSLVLSAFCSSAQAESVFGFVYKNARTTGEGFTNIAVQKTGSATCTSYFALVAIGECGIGDAARNGKIRNVAFYDTHTKNILGYQKITTTVYGQ